MVAAQLNTLLTKDMLSEHYFTMLFGYLNMTTGHVEFTQCGHPNAVVLNRSGRAQFIGEGGMPIGLIPGAEFESQTLLLQPGERLIFYSDGFTECENTQKEQVEEQGFGEIIEKNSGLTNEMLFDAMVWDLDCFAGGQEFGDDLSCVMVTYKSLRRSEQNACHPGRAGSLPQCARCSRLHHGPPQLVRRFAERAPPDKCDRSFRPTGRIPA